MKKKRIPDIMGWIRKGAGTVGREGAGGEAGEDRGGQ